VSSPLADQLPILGVSEPLQMANPHIARISDTIVNRCIATFILAQLCQLIEIVVATCKSFQCIVHPVEIDPLQLSLSYEYILSITVINMLRDSSSP
jgi:hypothetical protein